MILTVTPLLIAEPVSRQRHPLRTSSSFHVAQCSFTDLQFSPMHLQRWQKPQKSKWNCLPMSFLHTLLSIWACPSHLLKWPRLYYNTCYGWRRRDSEGVKLGTFLGRAVGLRRAHIIWAPESVVASSKMSSSTSLQLQSASVVELCRVKGRRAWIL